MRKTYHDWCKHYHNGKGKWVIHKLSEYNSRPDKEDSNNETSQSSAGVASAFATNRKESDDDDHSGSDFE